MPSNKNQHYVPQVYLKQFAGDEDRRQLNLILLKRPHPPVHGASIRDQCSSDYFYGEDARLEKALQATEGLYGKAMSDLEAGKLSPGMMGFLVWFAQLQQLRTERALSDRIHLITKMGHELLRGQLNELYGEPNRKEEIQANLKIFADSARALDDLAVAIVDNETSVPFIACDDPAILMNRLYSQRYGDPTSGLINSGVIIALPLTPRHYLIAYDAAVYQRIGSAGRLRLRSMSDVDRLNSLQILRAQNVVFYHDAKYDDYLARLVKAYAGLRREEWHRLWVGVPFEETEEHIGYRTATEEEKANANGLIVSFSPIIPEPAAWPRFINFKMRARGYTNGSAVGFIRGAHLDGRHGPFKEILLPRTVPAHQTKTGREVMYHRKDATEDEPPARYRI